MDSFEVSPASSTLVLDPYRRGRAAFTLHSLANRTVRARVNLVPIQPSRPEWFTMRGAQEQDILAGVTLQVAVEVAVPAAVEFGRYLFRLDVVGVENPAEDSVSSSAVAFAITSKVPDRPRVRPAYWEAASGAAVGAIAIGAAGAGPAALYALSSGGVAPGRRNQTALLARALLGSLVGAGPGSRGSQAGQGMRG